MLGINGIGKSTALKVLAGELKPNLGREGAEPSWAEIIAYYRGSDLQNYSTRLVEDKLRVSVKPQLDAAYVRALAGRKVRRARQRANARAPPHDRAPARRLC